jgi:hypothetical protein
LIKAGTLLNIWLYFHHGRTRDCECWKSSVCWIYGWTRRLTVPAGACTVHCGEAQGDTMEACVHRMLLLAYNNLVDEFRSQDFGLKLNWEAPMGSDLVYSILSPEWNADKTRVDKVRY